MFGVYFKSFRKYFLLEVFDDLEQARAFQQNYIETNGGHFPPSLVKIYKVNIRRNKKEII